LVFEGEINSNVVVYYGDGGVGFDGSLSDYEVEKV